MTKKKQFNVIVIEKTAFYYTINAKNVEEAEEIALEGEVKPNSTKDLGSDIFEVEEV